MATPSVLNLDQLLAPLAGENPSGENLLYLGLHDEIREARRSDDGLEQGAWKRDAKVSDWVKVERLAAGALESRTKDLQVCAWLIEALVRLHGFDGLRDGLRTFRGLMERYWDTLYPELDDYFEARSNAISFMDRSVALALREVPLTSSPAGTNYSYLQFQDSRKFEIPENADALYGEDLDRVRETRARAEKENKITGDAWRSAKNASTRAFYEGIWETLNECREEFKALDGLMDEKFGKLTPGMGELKKALQEITDLVEQIVKEKRALEPDPVPVAEQSEESGTQTPAQPGVAAAIAGPIRTRQEALKRLGEVSEYFRQTEPHSPVSYLVQRAIRWGQMPLEAWLEDVIKDGGVLSNLRETLGIKAP